MVSQELGILGISAAITAGIQLGGFVVAYALQTEKFYDVLGGINYLILGIYSAIDGEYEGNPWVNDKRKVLCTAIFLFSRGWLLLFLAWRAHERNGDSRFDEVKDKFGMFLIFWIFQGLWVFMISMPVIFVNSSDISSDFSVGDWILIVGFGLGALIGKVLQLSYIQVINFRDLLSKLEQRSLQTYKKQFGLKQEELETLCKQESGPIVVILITLVKFFNGGVLGDLVMEVEQALLTFSGGSESFHHSLPCKFC